MGILVSDFDSGEFDLEEEVKGETLEVVVLAGAGERLDSWIAGNCPGVSRSRIQGLAKAGMVEVNGKTLTRLSGEARPGDEITIRFPPPVPAEPLPEDIPLDIVYEDGSVLVLNKPAGLVVHPAPGHLSGTLVNAILHHCPSLAGIGGVARPGIVHRLDQYTSGLMVVAKTDRAMASLAHNFHTPGGIRKIYLAIVHGKPDSLSGRIENLIGRSPRDRKKMAIVQKNGKRAVTNWRILDSKGPVSLVECAIETGRTHQIRVHMASIGCPVIGDAVYGKPGLDRRLSPAPARQMLHAFRLSFPHPCGGREMAFEAPPPADFAQYALSAPANP